MTLLLPCGTPARAQEADSEASRHFLNARSAQASGDLKMAAQEYREVIRLAPDLAEARVNLGLVYYLQARYDESAEALEKALSLKPGLRGADLFLGIDFEKLGQSRRAVSHLRHAAAQEPSNKQARTWLASALWDAGQESEAISELGNADKAFPADPDILFLLGQAYRNAGNEEMERVLAVVGTPLYHQAYGDIYSEQDAWNQALGHYQHALEKDPNWRGAHLGLGEVYLQQGKLDKARSELLAEGAAGPTSAAATALLAEIALLEGQPEDALRLLNEAIQKDSDSAASALGLPPLPFGNNASSNQDAKAKYRQSVKVLGDSPSSPARSLMLAFVDLRLSLREESAREWQRYRTMVRPPSPAGNSFDRALREFERHDFDDARSHLIAFVSAYPHDTSARYLLARTSHALSLSVLAEMLSAAPDSPRTHQLMGQALAEREENERAMAEYRIVEAAAPSLGGLHFAIGQLLWKMNQADAAMVEFQQELRLNPAHAEASAAAGTILVREHKADQSIPYLERAILLKPGLLLAHQELGKALYQRREFAKAEGEFKKALADDPEGNVHYLLGNVYKQLGQTGEASAAFAEARRIKSERLNAVNANTEKMPEE
ncbi:MAG TPA: tetratricopeptide repeat protein [Bryobacteraceae bacterium]|nr:tetratricopeptide repeat protein [Bryobacteraceae bacterium]